MMKNLKLIKVEILEGGISKGCINILSDNYSEAKVFFELIGNINGRKDLKIAVNINDDAEIEEKTRMKSLSNNNQQT